MGKNLNDLRRLLEQDYLNTNAIVNMMVLIRKLLEEQKLKKDYPFLLLYSNWTVHWSIDRDEDCLKLLANLTDVLVTLQTLRKWKVNKDGGLTWNADDAMNTQVNTSLGISQLRNEFIKLFTNLNLPSDGFENTKRWEIFCKILSRNLVEQVIRFPIDLPKASRKIKQILATIEVKTKGDKDKQVVKFSLVPSSQIPNKILQSRDKSIDIFFQMETAAGIYFVGPFWISELTT
jgi:hypothetical protein